MRRIKREYPTEFLPEQNCASTEDIYIKRSQNQEVYSAIISLAEKFRTPIILFYFEDLSIREIAVALDLGEGAVKTRLARGRDKLKVILRRGDLNEFGETYSSSQTKLY
jgi:RNA polymerase sigma-70 factor (ECF subfamily)